MYVMIDTDSHRVEWIASDEKMARQLFAGPEGPTAESDPDFMETMDQVFLEAHSTGYGTTPGDWELHFVPSYDCYNDFTPL